MTSISSALSFLNASSADYMAELYQTYLRDPSRVDTSWKVFFDELNDSETALIQEATGASWTPDDWQGETPANDDIVARAMPQSSQQSGDVRQAAMDSVGALMIIRAYRARGTLIADLDPLNLKPKEYHPELDPQHYGFSQSDYNRPIFLGGVLGMDIATLDQILETLKATYCQHIGVEFLHLNSPEEKSWIQERIESPRNQTSFSADDKKRILAQLTSSTGFENFLHTKYTGTKRFGLDGGESLIPAIEQIIQTGVRHGLREIIFGMAHRGRLNVLTNILGKPYTAVFSEFKGTPSQPDDVLGSGDVKYHLGTSHDREVNGNSVHLSLAANPSHLEAVNPVVTGKVRAKQIQRNDPTGTQVMPLLLHGDAAFAGQGLVAETLMISELPGYRVSGTMHIVINNQIGFTTMPKFGRSGPYCTDIAKMLSAPIFHVNGDDVEAVAHVARLATEFRQTFKKDVVIDMFCYRRFGHNEGDEPAFTQPLMYKKISETTPVREIYAQKLVNEGVLSEAEAQAIKDDFYQRLESDFEAAQSYKPNEADWLQGAWQGLSSAHNTADGDARRGETGVSEDELQSVGKVLISVPDSFEANSKIIRQLKTKQEMLETKKGFDWATAEALAFGTLLKDGYSVRLSGQDVGRGTFSQRHAILYDQNTEEKYIPLQQVNNKTRFEAYDSPLSEAGVLGFEYGFASADPNTLVLWEAQFGDFVNGAQVIIDQFISSSEAKWLRMAGLVMLLPHGYEGQGPEHSSAHPERFLAACAQDNWQVANCTTPANYFHILRRQMCRDFRKPLVMFTPKSLLRHKLAVSPMKLMTEQSTFHRVLWDDAELEGKLRSEKKIKRVILCTGKVYYDLYQAREEKGIDDVVIIRVEQLYPFPDQPLALELARYPNAQSVVWCQEEPENMGYWQFMDRRIEAVLKTVKCKADRPVYAGREAAAAPATGIASRHKAEQEALVNMALGVK